MAERLGHRVRWALVWTLLLLWVASLVVNVGGAAANVLLVLGLVLLFYELLAADPASGRS